MYKNMGGCKNYGVVYEEKMMNLKYLRCDYHIRFGGLANHLHHRENFHSHDI